MKFNKKGLAVGLACVLSCGMLVGCTPSDSDIVATINGDKLTYGQANFYARYTEQQYETYYSYYYGNSSADIWKQSSDKEANKNLEDTTKDDIIEGLRDMFILEDHMDDMNVSLSKDEKARISKAADEVVKANSDEAKEKLSITKENATRILTLLTIQEKMYQAVCKDVDTNIPDSEAAQKKMHYIQFDFASNFTTVDSTEAAVNAYKDAADGKTEDEDKDSQDVAKKKAEDFEAKLKSENVNKDNIEDLSKAAGYEAKSTTFDKDSQTLSEEVIKAADSLGEGEMTVVEGADAYYVIYLDSKLDRDATDNKKLELVSQKQGEVFDAKLQEWEKDMKYDLHKSVWNKISFSDLGITTESN